MTVLWRWFLSRDGIRWAGAMIAVSFIVGVIRWDTNNRAMHRHADEQLDAIGMEVDRQREFSGAAVDTLRDEHRRILDGIYWLQGATDRIERKLEAGHGRGRR